MGSLQEQLFTKIASQTLVSLSKDLQKKYEPKKGDRFNYRAITYEIGPPKFTGEGISFEISSKIPESELPDGYKKESFFKEIKKICGKSKKKPLSTDMENIVRETKEQERKDALIRLLDFEQPYKSIIICRTKSETEILQSFLVNKKFKSKVLHGDLSQAEINRTIRDFKSGFYTMNDLLISK